MSLLRRTRRTDAETLEVWIQAAEQGGAARDRRVELAGALRSGTLVREGQRARTKARAMLAFENAQRSPTPASVEVDHDGDIGIHTAQVDGDGHVVHMADVEHIDPARAAEIARSVETIVTRQDTGK